MLRECIRYDSLASIVLNSDDFFKFFEYVEMSTFDIASDAFATFKVSVLVYSDRYSNSFTKGEKKYIERRGY